MHHAIMYSSSEYYNKLAVGKSTCTIKMSFPTAAPYNGPYQYNNSFKRVPAKLPNFTGSFLRSLLSYQYNNNYSFKRVPAKLPNFTGYTVIVFFAPF